MKTQDPTGVRPAMPQTALFLSLVLLATSVRAGSDWVLSDLMTGTTFNGVSIGRDGFAVLVGNSGTIVHRTAEGVETIADSGTTADLFDVFVVDATTAVATGRGIVLRWDGNAWRSIVEDAGDPVFTSVWISPEKDVVVYNIPGAQFDFRTTYDLVADEPLPVSAVSQFDIAYCGRSNEIKTVVQNGSITAFTNSLGPAQGTEDTFGTIFDNSANPLNLVAAWIPPDACPTGPFAPRDVFAIDALGTFHRFDPASGWSALPVDGGGIPFDHTLTWLAGSGPDNVVAVGFKPDGSGGNEGVVWLWDGATWSQDTTLPAGTPGLTDVAFRFDYDDLVFGDGYETASTAKAGNPVPGVEVDILAAAEEGERIANSRLFPNAVSHLTARKVLLDDPPFTDGQVINFRIVVTNLGDQRRDEIRLLDAFAGLKQVNPDGITIFTNNFVEDSISYKSDSCGTMPLNFNPKRARTTTFSLEPGASFECELALELAEGVRPGAIINILTIYTPDASELLGSRFEDQSVVQTATGF